MLVRDPKDSKYLNRAIEANARYVVTTDLDLLELMDAQSTVGIDFRNRFPGIQIISPADFEAMVRATP